MRYALGKLPARPEAVALKFSAIFSASRLPAPPSGRFGKPWLVKQWGMLDNDTIGDCVLATAAHDTMLWRAEAALPEAPFVDKLGSCAGTVLADYSAITGWRADDPSTDVGTDMQQAASYRRRVGILDANGVRHKTDAYVALRVGDIDQLRLAVDIFGSVDIGVRLPSSAMDQFDHAEPWHVVPDTGTDGGHCVSCVASNSAGNLLAVTWGRLQAMTDSWLHRYMDEGIASLSLERLHDKVSPRGYDETKLRDYLAQVARS